MKSVTSASANNDFVRELSSLVLGSPVSVNRREADWTFEFANNFVVGVGTLWRLVSASYVCVTSEDDGHQFGLPAPIDAAAKANGLLAGKTIQAVNVDFRTGDLNLQFEGPLTLQTVTTSGGYESWQMWRSGDLFAVGGSGGLR